MLDTVQYIVGMFSVLCFGISQWGWKKHRDDIFPSNLSEFYRLSFPIGAILGILALFATIALQFAK